MKFLSTLIIILAFGLLLFNATKLDFSAPFEGESILACITILAALCAIILMLILRLSKRIEKRSNQNK